MIVDRLNSIELLDYYIDKNIQYSFGRPNYADPISYTIRTKSGGCDELALLGQTALNRAGYKTEARRIGSDSELHVGLVVKLDDGKYILAVNFKTSNVVTGPHNSLYEADQALGYRPSMGYRGSFNFHRWE